MRRRVGAAVVLLTLAVASAGAIAAAGGGVGSDVAKKKPIPYEETDLFIETNATDGDAGLQLFMDGEDWDKFTVTDPKGRKLMEARTKGRLRHWGLTEFFWEAAEPEFGEIPFEQFKKRFPEGKYRFKGKTVEGRKLVGSDKLSHLIPDGPVITNPTKGELVDPADFTVSWEPTTTPTGVEIVAYEVIVVHESLGREFDIDLPSDATSVTVPPEFLTQDPEETKVEVLARDRSGNQTITEVPFTVK